jgi:hypothetical protein
MTTKATEARLTEVEIGVRAAKEKKRKSEEAQLKRDLNEAFSSPAGRRALRWIMRVCGYQHPSIVADPRSGEIVFNSTIYNEARRNFYLTLRGYLPRRILTQVELQDAITEDLGQDLFM